MKVISSVFTLLAKFLLLLKSIFMFLIFIYFILRKEYIISIVLFLFGFLLLRLSRLMKSIYVKNGYVVVKGFFSKKKYQKEEIIKIGNIPLLFFLKLKNGKRIYFFGNLKDEINAFFTSPELVGEKILNRIKKE